MTERYFFFDDYQNDERIYGAQEFSLYFQQLIGSGYTAKYLGTGISRYNPFSEDEKAENLVVSANGQNMIVSISTGAAFIAGRGYFNDAAMTKPLANANATMDRIDRIVLRLNLNDEARNIHVFVKPGQPSSNPAPPGLQNDDRIKEISLARITVQAGKSYIDPTDVRDERAYKELGGYLPLHNIYRGFLVDSNGIASQPNNSFVRTEGQLDQTFSDRVYTPLRMSGFKQEDRQNELLNDHKFRPKTSGAYYISGYISFDEKYLPVGTDVQLQVGINGNYDSLLVARTVAHDKDNIFNNGDIFYLEQGDIVEIALYVMGSLSTYKCRGHRVRIAKLF